jgi:Spy/CpxP family protein refolding chaperone
MRQGSHSRHLWWPAGLGLVLVGLWAAVGWAQPMRGHRAWSHDTPLPVLLRAAGVSDTQKDQIKAIVAAHRPTLRRLHSQLRTANQTLSDALLASSDPTQAIQEINQIRSQLLAETVKTRQDVLGVLSQEQLAKVAQLREQLRALQAERHNLLTGGTSSAQ